MAAAADRARFYLEQSIPDLHELERKKIFSKVEITEIIRKRSDYEHKINAPGTKPADFVRYTQFELNVERLRSKRAKRLGAKNLRQNGHKRALSILDRATKKFHGNLKLWWFYVDVAKKQKAFKKIPEILTNLVRLHPTKPEIWIYAANYAIEEHGDMTEGRSYFQRGLRFCKSSKDLWLFFARSELNYISKITARQQILGLTRSKTKQIDGGDLEGSSADMIALPKLTPRDVDPTLRADKEPDKDALQVFLKTPALSGEIPTAIFDAASAHFGGVEFSMQFFNLLCDLGSNPCSLKISQHVIDQMSATDPRNPIAVDCWIRQPLIGVSINTADFPGALSNVFTRLTSSLDNEPSVSLVQKTASWIVRYLERDLDGSVKTALCAMLLRTLTKYKSIINENSDPTGDATASMLELAFPNATDIVEEMLPWALASWPSNEKLIRLEETSRDKKLLTDLADDGHTV